MFGWNWQGVHLRVVGVCDSKSSIFVSDVLSMEFDDKFLLELCQLKSNGSSLLTLSTTSGNSITIYIYVFAILIKMDLQFYLYVFFFSFEGAEYQVLTSSDSVTKLIDIAALLGKSMGMW